MLSQAVQLKAPRDFSRALAGLYHYAFPATLGRFKTPAEGHVGERRLVELCPFNTLALCLQCQNPRTTMAQSGQQVTSLSPVSMDGGWQSKGDVCHMEAVHWVTSPLWFCGQRPPQHRPPPFEMAAVLVSSVFTLFAMV